MGHSWSLDSFSEGCLPVLIRRTPDHELVVVVVPAFETQLADLDFGAKQALVLRFVQDLSLAA